MRCGGGGSGIALCRDLVVMADDARIRYMPARVPVVTATAAGEIITARIPSLQVRGRDRCCQRRGVDGGRIPIGCAGSNRLGGARRGARNARDVIRGPIPHCR